MNTKKTLLVLGAITGIGLAGVTGLGVASAATGATNGGDTIIDKLSAKFHLDKDEVKVVFEDERAEREAEHQQRLEERLTKAVEEGTLTEEQKSKILAKLEELKIQRETFNDKTPKERGKAKQEIHGSLEQWAQDNNIPLKYLMAHGPQTPGMHVGMPDEPSSGAQGRVMPADPANR